MKLLTTSNAKKGLLLILKTFGFLFTAFFAFIDIVFGDSDEDQESDDSNHQISEEYKRNHDASYDEYPENVNHVFSNK